MKRTLIYIAAASHSGSTLTAMLLSAHPQLASVGELKATHLADPKNYLCSCHTLVKDCPFWRSVTEKMQEYGHSFSIFDAGTDFRYGSGKYAGKLLKPLVRGPLLETVRDTLLAFEPGWGRRLARIQKRNADLVAAVQSVTHSKAVVDSSKIGIRLKYLLKNPELDIKVVWLVRDGRGVAQAYKEPSRFADAKDPSFRGGGVGVTAEAGRGVRRGAREWMRCNQETEAILSSLDQNRWLKVHYEQLCMEPETTLTQICRFIGIDPSQLRLDFKHVEHHVIGNGMRLDLDDTISLDERWREELTEAELREYFDVVGNYHVGLGYDRG